VVGRKLVGLRRSVHGHPPNRRRNGTGGDSQCCGLRHPNACSDRTHGSASRAIPSEGKSSRSF
jgi:hypothetical protein